MCYARGGSCERSAGRSRASGTPWPESEVSPSRNVVVGVGVFVHTIIDFQPAKCCLKSGKLFSDFFDYSLKSSEIVVW